MHASPRRLSTQPGDIEHAATLLRQGALVAFPTETVYGLGADAYNTSAVASIFEAKGRPSFNPLIVHVATAAQARDLVQWSDAAEALSTRFWPGPLTLVLPRAADSALSSLVTAGQNSVAVRIPHHPAAQAVLQTFAGPVAAPSANPSGRISPTTAAHVLSGLGDTVAAVVDDGPCPVGIESTIVGLLDQPRLLRSGGIAAEDLEDVLGFALAPAVPNAITAPGQLASHYAPTAPVRLNASDARPGELMLGFGPMACDVNLSPSGDLKEAAARLFDALHALDARGVPIAVAPIPQTGLGVAINDRLSRAAAPR